MSPRAVKRAPQSGPDREQRVKTAAIEIAGVRLTHPDRVVFIEQAITKRELAEYYLAVADRMLPHLAGRPLTLVRCPAGMRGPCFYQKQPPEGLPEVVGRIRVPMKSRPLMVPYVEDVAGLLTLIQFGVLEIHTWQSHIRTVERPDQIVFDLDPGPGVAWSKVVETAFVLRELLKGYSLTSFAKTTGGKGLHVVAPIAAERPWSEVKDFSKCVVMQLADLDPEHFTISMSKAERSGRIFLDYLRNDRGATAVAPYSTRARANCPLSWPLSWRDLKTVHAADAFTVSSVQPLLKKRGRNPWGRLLEIRQRISDVALADAKKSVAG